MQVKKVETREEKIKRVLRQVIIPVIIVFSCNGMVAAGEHVWTTNGPKGGIINTVVYDPRDPDTAYLSVVGGGIFRSVNGGKSWRQVASVATLGIEPDHENQINQIAVDPVDNNILYAAGSDGVVKSLDGGLNWQRLETGVSGVSWDIIIHPADTDTLFIGTNEGIFKSTDAGSNWIAVNSGLTSLEISSLTICNANPNVLYASCWGGPVVFKTSDGGDSWIIVFSGSIGEQTRTVVVDPTNANIVYTSEYENGGTLKSTNGGATWTKTGGIDFINWDANVIVVDPINPGIVYFGRNVGQLFKSVDAGSNWTEKTNGFTSRGDIYALAVNSLDNDNILVGTMASIFRSGDDAQSWLEGNSGLNFTNIAALAIDPANPDLIYAGTYGGGLSISSDGGTTWRAANNGIDCHSIDAIAVNPISTNIVYIGGTFGQIFKSINSGGSWVEIFYPGPGKKGAPHSIVIDPDNTNIIYAGMARDGQGGYTHSNPRGIFKSVDAGATWNEFNAGLSNLDVRTLIIDPNNTNTLYAGTVGSGVFKTVNGAASWSSSNSGLTNPDVRALVLNAASPNIIYVGTNGGGMFKSINGGATWTPINNDLTGPYISAFAVDRTNGNKVFAGTEYGTVYGSIDGGTSWVAVNEGRPYNLGSIEAIVISPANPNLLYIGTCNGGVFQRTIDPETIVPNPPKISLNRTQFFFGTVSEITTPSQTFSIENSGGGTLNWSITDNADWLSCTPHSGTDSDTVSMALDASGLSAGTYTGAITITDPNASNSPQSISVELQVYNQGTTAVPFGEFATPVEGAATYSSIPVTGWALDDVGLASVKIYNGDSYVGDAVFVEGARPDVQTAYPNYPNNYKAGWGYMLLTYFLPGGGNGTYTLVAKAVDIEGNEVVFGSKTITIDNAHAVKPFGAIDTPTQGGTAMGSSYVNWGWVLTPQPNSVAINGSTIIVWVDGVNKGHPTYNIYRSDIAGLFPGYANSNGAVGYFYLDTTKYANGLHTIQWTAKDNAGNSDGIGSRYVTIQNTSSASAQSVTRPLMKMNLQQIYTLPEDSSEPIYFSKGFHTDSECLELLPDKKGNSQLTVKELERVEIQLSQNFADIQGYLISGNQLNKLPIGSTLDARCGTFSWSPGPGFLGSYSLVFVLTDSNGQSLIKSIEITIEPKFTNSYFTFGEVGFDIWLSPLHLRHPLKPHISNHPGQEYSPSM
jgi:photosystem II stability/assembly factor-like uncharacterized protein